MPRHRTRSRAFASVIACLVVATGLSLVSSSPAAADPPTNLSPNGETVSGSPVLAWERSSATAKYDVDISTSPTFATILDSVNGTVNHQWVPDEQLPTGTLYWRVRVDGTSEDYATAEFTHENVGAPTQTGPADAAQLEQPASPPVLSWDPVPGAEEYEVQYGTDPNFVGQTSTATTESSSYTVGLQAPGEYFWRVRGELAAGIFTEWSGGWSYHVEPLSTPVLVSPNNDVNENLRDVVLDWDPVSGAESYDVQISTDSNFLTVDTDASRTGILGTRYSPPETLDNDQFYWRVRPVDAAGNKPDWTAMPVWQFRRNWPYQPSLEYPADGATVGDPVYFQWTPVELASKYTIEMSPNPTFLPESSVKRCTTVHTTYTPGDESDCMPTALQSYYWRVLATDEFSDELPVTDLILAQVRSFTYDPAIVEQASPADGEVVTVPTLTWNPVSGASRYKVTLTSSGGGTVTKETATTSWTPTSLSEGTWTWMVQTVTENGDLGSGLTLDSRPAFTLTAPAEPTATHPDPSPVDVGSSYRFPTLRWTPVVGAGHYKVLVKRTTDIGWQPLASNFEFPAGEDTGTSHLAPGDYEWYVQAFNTSGGLLSAGSVGTFTIEALPIVPLTSYHAAITGTALTAGGAGNVCDATLPASCQNLRQTPVLGWSSPNPNTGYYKIYISRDAELTNLVMDPFIVTSTMWISVSALADSQAGSAYFWTVLPCITDDYCLPPQHADHAFNKQSRPLTLVSPADDAVVQDDVTFTWDDYLVSQAVDEGADPDTGTPLDTPARTEARQYRIQTSTDPNFVTNVVTTSVDQRTFTSFADTYPEGTNYWRVQAVDGTGNLLAWSEVRSFVKQSPAPVLTLPTEGQEVPGDSTLSWEPLDFASAYSVEVYKLNDMIPSTANRVVNVTTERIAYVLPALDPAAGPYTWRVRRKDAEGRLGAWSALRSFTVSKPAPALASPAAGAQVEPSDGLFTWDVLAGAAKYKFERRKVGTTTVVEPITTPALAAAPTDAITGGSWEWRVIAYDTKGHALGAAEWRPFTVVDTPVATTPVSISGSGAVGTPLTLNPPTWNMPDGTVTTTYQWYRGTSAIAGQTGITYDVVNADVGKAITVKATGTRPGYKTGTSTSNAITGALGPAIAPTEPPSFTGVMQARETLTADPGSWPGSPSFTYQWFVNNVAVATETDDTYVVRARDAGLPVKVRVTATTAGYGPGTAYSASKTVARLASTTTASLQKKTISRRGRGVITVTVSVKDLGSPLGDIQVKEGAKQLARVRLGNDAGGTVTIRLKRLLSGRHRLVVTYLGSIATKSSRDRVVLKVTRS